MTPSNAQHTGSERDRKKQTPHFRTYSWRALFDLPQTLHGGRARRAHPKRWQPFFDQVYTLGGKMLIFGY